MIAIEPIKFTVSIVGDKEMEKLLLKCESEQTEFTTDENKLLNRYLNGLNIAVDTIASRFYESVKVVSATTSSEQKIDYNDLDERVLDIVSVLDKSGFEVDYYALPFSLYLPQPNTTYSVKLKVLPKKVAQISDQVSVLPFVPTRAIAYLMASDIFLARGLFDDSKYWFREFETSMNQAVSSRRVRCMAIKRI